MSDYTKYEIWGHQWIREQFYTPIPEKLIIAALNKETNDLKAFEFEKSDITAFLINHGYTITPDEIDLELIKKIIDFYYLDWMLPNSNR